MIQASILAIALASMGCPAIPQAEPTTSRATSPIDSEVQVLLDRLYRSFNYGPGEEPDWKSMRASFVDGAQFVPEPTGGSPLRSYDVDALIAKWQSSMRSGASVNLGYSEWIATISISKIGALLRVDVVFCGKEPGDPHQRQPGLDSLLLARVDGTWKVLSFVVHEESKL